MVDIMSKEQRSRHMALVRCRDTRFELNLMRLLSAELYPMGYRYRKHHRAIFGTPDLAFVSARVVVFLDSDFWHGRNFDRLESRMTDPWREKIRRNMARDREVNRRLRRDGWMVLRFGERQVKKQPLWVVNRVKAALERRA